MSFLKYCESLTTYQRRKTIEVQIGDVPLGANNPIRVQSMTTTDTMDTIGTVEQSIRMINAGCEYVRITAPSIKEAENLGNIRKELHKRGYTTPLVADIHFTPNAAEIAAKLVEKVRINPGNYVDKKRFEIIEYTDEQYNEEIERIREKFIPFLKICKEYGTAIRIGSNHGSLSDRIINRYGDNPLGMVESALEFVRICEEFNFYNVVLSMKSSNPQVMVQAYRLLVNHLEKENLKPYPLHLGVTEAGDGEDGRIKSAMGIGTLLEDGLGDTVRVSLTEEPEAEMPVGQKLVDRYTNRAKITSIEQKNELPITENNFSGVRKTFEVENFGKDNVPRVIVDFSQIQSIEMSDFKSFGYTYLPLTDKWGSNDTAADYVYLGNNKVPFMMPNGLKAIQNYDIWKDETEISYPLFDEKQYLTATNFSDKLNFLYLKDATLEGELLAKLKQEKKYFVLIIATEKENIMPTLRHFARQLIQHSIEIPIVLKSSYDEKLDLETLQIYASTDCGGVLIDGLGNGIMLNIHQYSSNKNQSLEEVKNINSLSFGILQAARTRMTKTEYISCPSCGRTLFDLQETTAMIRKRTDHLKGLKIGIMGCIVNGPGEMADADYGYVGSGKGKITLYKGQEVIKRSVPSDNAVDELINLIKEDGRWIDSLV
ncbi:MAG: 4-hydroxy-3-methylbut-2-en-1-yl diphosphate synthase [Bacteroidetes bacterium]|nr:MAG: 4-hydroxy-3-methylbut-2-en-1-yl diphosphate synthase [Bacteroidota bacterium]TAG89174.1 MAG: 4-hydroxy-3-methylbut-2-en-1-yl diphosphate synthase [Bacteroidota bacterium]